MTGLMMSFGFGHLWSPHDAAPQTAFMPQFPYLYKGQPLPFTCKCFTGYSTPSCQGKR